MLSFPTPDHKTGNGYLALPKKGSGPGVLVLHAWWGLTPFFKSFCDELAAQGFVAFAPDLWDGKTAKTRAQAEALLKTGNHKRMQAIAEGSLACLQGRKEVVSKTRQVAAVGFSMGASWSLELAGGHPKAFSALCMFYDTVGVELPKTIRFQAHFGDRDEFEPVAGVKKWQADLAAHGRANAVYIYPGAGHWFFESNQPGHYRPADAVKAKERLLAFLKAT